MTSWDQNDIKNKKKINKKLKIKKIQIQVFSHDITEGTHCWLPLNFSGTKGFKSFYLWCGRKGHLWAIYLYGINSVFINFDFF